MIEFLNTIEISDNQIFVETRFPVQYVNRHNPVFRGFCGTVAAGIFGEGDIIMVLPSDKTSRIRSIVTFDGEQEQAFAPMSITLTLTDEIDTSRGDVIVGQQQVSPTIFDRFTATIVCKIEQPMTPGRQYLIKQASRSPSGSISMIQHRIDFNTLKQKDVKELKLIKIGCCTLAVNAPVVFDPYDLNKSTGSFIAIDLLINITVGAGMINGDAREEVWIEVSVKERSNRYAQRAAIIALDGSNAWPLAYHLKRRLFDNGYAGTTLEQPNNELADPIKNVDLLVLCIGNQPLMIDIAFDCDYQSTDEIYTMLKSRRVIH